MFQDDWLQRQFAQVAAAIARAMGMTTRDEAQQELQRAGRDAFGVNSRLALSIGADDLRALLGDPERVRAFAELLAAEARVEADPARAAALAARSRALREG